MIWTGERSCKRVNIAALSSALPHAFVNLKQVFSKYYIMRLPFSGNKSNLLFKYRYSFKRNYNIRFSGR